jgi:hypothetical protein
MNGPYVVGDDCTDLMGAPEGGKFVALDAPAASHYAFAIVVVRVASDDPGSAFTKQLEGTARLLASAPDLLKMLERIYAAEFGYDGWPDGPEIRDLIISAGGQV